MAGRPIQYTGATKISPWARATLRWCRRTSRGVRLPIARDDLAVGLAANPTPHDQPTQRSAGAVDDRSGQVRILDQLVGSATRA